MREIAVLNRSTVTTDDEVRAIVDALQQDIDTNFAEPWAGAHLSTVAHFDEESWKGKPNITVLDDSDEANALGYHDFTPEGLPLGKAFAKTDKQYGAELSVTLSHEVYEMLVDPNIRLLVEDDERGVFVAFESADAVEADELAHDVNGIKISNFVLPNYFVRGAPGPYDFGHVLSNPLDLAEGGYEAYYTPGRGWEQRMQRRGQFLASDRPRVGSRRERRRTPGRYLQRSAA